MATLTAARARRLYDRIGALQDTQRFYEDPATERVVEHGSFATARAVFEFGCGTGRFARRLLASHLPEGASYRGVDVSPEMIRLASRRLAPFHSRAVAILSDGTPPTGEPACSCDRFVANYVFDLLSPRLAAAVLNEAHRMLVPGGLLCLAGLSGGTGPVSRIVAGAIGAAQAVRPSLTGGCRPVELSPLLETQRWEIAHDEKIVAWSIPSEALVARRL